MSVQKESSTRKRKEELPCSVAQDDKHAVSSEIKARGPRAKLAYVNALTGKVKVYRARIMLIGQERAGKTSFKKSLLVLPFDPEEQSTEGIEVDPSKWQRTDEKLDVSYFVNDLARMVAGELQEIKETHMDSELQNKSKEIHSKKSQEIVDKQDLKVTEHSTMLKCSHDQITTLKKCDHLHQTEGQLPKRSDRVVGVKIYVYETGQHGISSTKAVQEAKTTKDVVTGAAPTSSHSMPKEADPRAHSALDIGKGDKDTEEQPEMDTADSGTKTGDWCGWPVNDLVQQDDDSYGRRQGRQAQVAKKHKNKWVWVVHAASEELRNFSIGPKVAEAYKRASRCSGQHRSVFELTPGVIENLCHVRRMYEDDNASKFLVLFGGSSKYFKLKGCDIAAQVTKLLNTPSYHLIVVLRPHESENVAEIKQALLNEGIDPRQLSMRISESHEDWHRWLCEVDLVIKPSRTEGFGMSGLIAISANLPVLVSRNSGLGVVLKKTSSGVNHVEESDDPQVWADKIKEDRGKDSQTRRLEAKELRNEYARQCKKLLERCLEIVQQDDEGTMSSAQNLDPFNGVDYIQRKVQRATQKDKDSANEQEDHSSCDVVDAGVKRQVNRLPTKISNIPLIVYHQVCVMLNAKRNLRFDDFRMLAEKVGLDRNETDYIEQTFTNHTDEILRTWSTKSEATVGKLIELLKEDGFERMDVAKILEDWVNEK